MGNKCISGKLKIPIEKNIFIFKNFTSLAKLASTTVYQQATRQRRALNTTVGQVEQ